MDKILLPKNETGSPERWETKDVEKFESETQQLEFYAQHLNILSERTKEIDERIGIEEGKLLNFKQEIDNASKENKRIGTLVYVGFIALLLVVIGIVFGYVEYIYGGAIFDSYRRDLGVKIEAYDFILQNTKSEDVLLKKDIEKIKEILNCQKNIKYWQYEQCFK